MEGPCRSDAADLVDNTQFDVPSPRFDIRNDAELKRYLHEHGYCVVKGVASPDELERAESLMWEHLKEDRGMKAGDLETWKVTSPEGDLTMSKGIVNTGEVEQSDFLWYVRTLPSIREIYSMLWNTGDLIVSYDKMGFFRPWHNPRLGRQYKTANGWYHVDLGARADMNHPEKYPYQELASGDHCHALQGLLCLYDQNETTGGLVLLPGSHKMLFEHVLPILAKMDGDEDFHAFHEDHDLNHILQNDSSRSKLVQAKAGDFIIWDSRTVHANTPALRHPQTPEDRLLRAVAYVAMAPAAWASEAAREYRRCCYERRQCTITGHMPHFPELQFDRDAQEYAALWERVGEVKRLLSDAPAAVQALVDPWYSWHEG
jgi:hypothetical protein